ncbi:MAG: hypothetical protein GYB68_07700 [Chloroflexi bacterium]|nr:hypothetical protein [Chloroflexota bacterium]
MDQSDALNQARQFIEQGKPENARTLLAEALRNNRDDLTAWTLFYRVAHTQDERTHCLQQVLRLDPANAWAAAELQRIQSAPQTSSDSDEVQQQIAQLSQQVKSLSDEFVRYEQYEMAEDKRERRSGGVIAVLVFVGTLLGTLFGAVADFGGSLETIDNLRSLTYPSLCLVGSSTILGDEVPMANQWREAYEAANDVNVQINSIGSVNGIDAAVNGECVHILAMSEPMTASQYQRLTTSGVEVQCAAEIGYDVVAFVTDPNNPIEDMDQEQLQNVLLGRTLEWWRVAGRSEGQIWIMARSGSGTTEFVLRNMGYNPTPEQEFPPDANYVVCDGNTDCLNDVLTTPGALFWVSVSWLRTQPEEYLHLIPVRKGGGVDAVLIDPLEADVDLAQYPTALIRPLYMYVVDNTGGDTDATARAQDFLTYVRGVEGQQILEESSFFTHFNRPVDLTVPMPPGFEIPDVGLREICPNN